MMRKNVVLIVVGLCFALTGIAQNQLHLGQYMLYKPWVNEAAIASYDNWAASGVYKNQWVGMQGAPKIFGVHALYPFSDASVSSFSVISDKIGVNSNTQLNGTYAYRMSPGFKNILSFSLTASLNLMQSDYTQIVTTDGEDPLFSDAKTQTFAMPNFKFGTYFEQNDAYIGFSIPNLLENKILNQSGAVTSNTTFNARNMHYYIVAGFRRVIDKNWDYMPSVLFKQASGSPAQVDVNFSMEYKKTFGFGLSYRTSNELLIMLNYSVIEDIKVAYAYEYNFSGKTNIGQYGGSHELMVVYQFGRKEAEAPEEDPEPTIRPTLGEPQNGEGEGEGGQQEGEKSEGEK